VSYVGCYCCWRAGAVVEIFQAERDIRCSSFPSRWSSADPSEKKDDVEEEWNLCGLYGYLLSPVNSYLGGIFGGRELDGFGYGISSEKTLVVH